MKFVFVTFGLFILAALFIMDEALWVILICAWMGRALLGKANRAARGVATLICASVLTAHFFGYKIFGSATIRDNRPVLTAPQELASFASPNPVVATDGSRFAVRGVTFTPALLELAVESLPRIFYQLSGPVLVQPDAASASGIFLQRRCNYWCGNTFMPTIVPPRLPAYAREDMGHYLLATKYATVRQDE